MSDLLYVVPPAGNGQVLPSFSWRMKRNFCSGKVLLRSGRIIHSTIPTGSCCGMLRPLPHAGRITRRRRCRCLRRGRGRPPRHRKNPTGGRPLTPFHSKEERKGGLPPTDCQGSAYDLKPNGLAEE